MEICLLSHPPDDQISVLQLLDTYNRTEKSGSRFIGGFVCAHRKLSADMLPKTVDTIYGAIYPMVGCVRLSAKMTRQSIIELYSLSNQ